MPIKIRFLLSFLAPLFGYIIASSGAWYWKSSIGHTKQALDIYYAWSNVTLLNMPKEILFTTFIGFFVFLIMMSLALRIKSTRYGSARWAFKSEHRKFGLNSKEGIILAKNPDGSYIKTNRPLSVLVLAPPGTGKSSGIIIPTLLTTHNSCVIHDTKGELYNITADARREFSDVYLFDPTSENTCRFNVLAKEMLPDHADDCHRYVSNLATLLIKSENKRSQDDFFIKNTRQLFIFFAEYLIHKNPKHGTSIASVFDLFLSEENKDKLIRDLIKEEDCPGRIKKIGDGVLTNAVASAQWAGVTATMNIALEIFRDTRIAAATSGTCSFTGTMLRKGPEGRPISVYLKVRDKDKESIAPLISMFFESIGRQLLSEEPIVGDNIVTFVLDEFVRLGKHDTIKDLPALSRSYGLNCIFAAQDYDQITETYGQEAVPIFETNCEYKVVLRQNSRMTAERVSKLIGNHTVKKRSYSHSNRKEGGGNVTVSEEGVPLLTEQAILGMKENDCIIIVGGYANRPIKAKIAFWFKDKTIKELVPEEI
jgi:type IV secretion system protein VirD4